MLNKSIIAALALVGAASASPFEKVERDVCNHDNLLRCFIDQRYSTSASAYCSGLTPSTKTVATVTPTITKTIFKSATANAVTNTITSTTTVYTATVPSLTATITQAGGGNIKERLVANNPPVIHAQPPKCMTSGTSYPASRITSACACISVPAKTVSVTYTACTKSTTVTSTITITPTVTATAWQTVSTVTTGGVATVTVSPPPPPPPANLITNGDFETGVLTPWQTSTGNPSAWTISVVTFESPSGNGHVLQLFNSASGSNAFIASPNFGVNAVSTYTLSFSIRNTVDISQWQSLIIVQVNCGSITVASPSLVNQGVAVDNQYYKFTSQFVTPAATTTQIANQLKTCQLQVLFKGGLQPPNTWYFDDASISPA